MRSNARPFRVAAILAGGKSQRMGNVDKAILEIGGQRLIDLVNKRVKPQTDEILLSARTDYGTGLKFIPDQLGRLAGPVAGLWAVANWINTHSPAITGFFTVPVDAPSISQNLFDRLAETEGSAIATSKSGLHPTFGYWEIAPILQRLKNVSSGKTISLRGLSESVGATHIQFQDEHSFANINCPQDAEAFEKS